MLAAVGAQASRQSDVVVVFGARAGETPVLPTKCPMRGKTHPWLNYIRPHYKDTAETRKLRKNIPEVFGSKDVFDAFVSSSNVTAQRLHWRPETLTNSPGGLSSYKHEKPVPVTPALAQKVQDLLQQASSYDWGPYAKGCIVDYGVLLTFHSSKRTVRVALCFNCNWLGIFDGEDENSNAVNREDDFDPIRRQLVSVVKAIFPDDAEIQDLK